MEVKREKSTPAGVKMEPGISVKREPVFGPGGLLRIKSEFQQSMGPFRVKREFKTEPGVPAEPLDIKPQLPPMGVDPATAVPPPTNVIPKLEPNAPQEDNRVAEVLKRHFKGEPGAADNTTKKPRPAASTPPAAKKKFKCHRCSYSVATVASLDNHVRYKHMKEPKPFRCTYNGNCGYTAMSNGTIVSHVNRVHLKVKKFKCRVAGCTYAGVYQRNLNQHTKIQHPERFQADIKPRRMKAEWIDSPDSESDDEIEILSSVGDAVVTLSDEESHNSQNSSSLETSDIQEDGGGRDAQENGGEKAKEAETADRDTEFEKSLLESGFWFTVTDAEDVSKEAASSEAGAPGERQDSSDDVVACDSDYASAPDVEESDDVEFISSDKPDALSGGSAALVGSIIDEILDIVLAASSSSAAEATLGNDQGRAGQAPPAECEVVETIGIDEEDIVALDITADDEGGIEVLSEVSHNEIWKLPEIIMLDD